MNELNIEQIQQAIETIKQNSNNDTLKIILSIVGVLLPIIVSMITMYFKNKKQQIKQKQQLQNELYKKLHTIIEVLDIYIENNGVDKQVKTKIKTIIERELKNYEIQSKDTPK